MTPKEPTGRALLGWGSDSGRVTSGLLLIPQRNHPQSWFLACRKKLKAGDNFQ